VYSKLYHSCVCRWRKRSIHIIGDIVDGRKKVGGCRRSGVEESQRGRALLQLRVWHLGCGETVPVDPPVEAKYLPIFLSFPDHYLENLLES
jgi:hypothetical protein